jgi:hypothetical protein
LRSVYLANKGQRGEFLDALFAVTFTVNVILHARYMSLYGRLVGKLKSGGSVVLSRNVTVDDGEKAILAFCASRPTLQPEMTTVPWPKVPGRLLAYQFS